MHLGNEELLKDIRTIWSNPLLVNRAGRKLEDIEVDIENGTVDLVPVGVWSLANLDFPERLKAGAILNEPDTETFFGAGSKGYTDYPTLKD